MCCVFLFFFVSFRLFVAVPRPGSFLFAFVITIFCGRTIVSDGNDDHLHCVCTELSSFPAAAAVQSFKWKMFDLDVLFVCVVATWPEAAESHLMQTPQYSAITLIECQMQPNHYKFQWWKWKKWMDKSSKKWTFAQPKSSTVYFWLGEKG